MSTETDQTTTVAEKVGELLGHLTAARMIANEIEVDPDIAPAIDEICERWVTWRKTWKHRGEGVLLYSGRDFEPSAKYFSLTETVDDFYGGSDSDLSFVRQDHHDDPKETASIPGAYFLDPDAWEAEAEASGTYRDTTEEVLAAEERRAQAASRAEAAEVEKARALLAERGFTVSGGRA